MSYDLRVRDDLLQVGSVLVQRNMLLVRGIRKRGIVSAEEYGLTLSVNGRVDEDCSVDHTKNLILACSGEGMMLGNTLSACRVL